MRREDHVHGPVRVLLVEDNVDHVRAARRGLADDFEVTHVHTAAQALEVLDQRGYQVTLVDHRLPDGDGVGLCRQVREAGHEGLVLLVTGAPQDGLARRAFRAGADDLLQRGPRYVERLAEELHVHLGTPA